MRTLIALLFLLPQLAQADAYSCFHACKAVPATAAIKCTVAPGGFMIIDQVKPMESRDKALASTLRECFFVSGGQHFEMHYAGKPRIMVCGPTGPRVATPFFCEGADKKDSLRNQK